MGPTISRKQLAASALWLTASLVLAPAARAIEPAEPSYRIQFDRPIAVGQSWHIDVTGVHDFRWTMRNQDGHLTENSERTYGCKLAGRVTVLAIRGNTSSGTVVTREQIAIDTLCDYDGKTDRQLLPASTVVLAESRSRQTVFSIAGHPPNLLVQRALAMLIHLEPSSEQPRYRDRAFGTDRPVHPGDSWPVDSAVLAARLNAPGNPISADAIHGNVTLGDVETVNQKPWLKLVVNLRMDPFTRARTASSAPTEEDSPTTRPPATRQSPPSPAAPTQAVQVDTKLQITYELPADPSSRAFNINEIEETHYTGQAQRNHRLNDYVETSRIGTEQQIRP